MCWSTLLITPDVPKETLAGSRQIASPSRLAEKVFNVTHLRSYTSKTFLSRGDTLLV
jgi:hypothetical protein